MTLVVEVPALTREDMARLSRDGAAVMTANRGNEFFVDTRDWLAVEIARMFASYTAGERLKARWSANVVRHAVGRMDPAETADWPELASICAAIRVATAAPRE